MKLGIQDVDLMHALENVLRIHIMDGYLMVVGPPRDGQPFEIGYRPDADRIFHGMQARAKYL